MTAIVYRPVFGQPRRDASEDIDGGRYEVMPFGMWKGCELGHIAADAPWYVEWIVAQPWFAQKFPRHYQYFAARLTQEADGPHAA